MGPLLGKRENDRPHPGDFALRRDQKPFEERFLDFQTFFIGVGCNRFVGEIIDLPRGRRAAVGFEFCRGLRAG